MPSEAKTSSKLPVNFVSRSRMRNHGLVVHLPLDQCESKLGNLFVRYSAPGP